MNGHGQVEDYKKWESVHGRKTRKDRAKIRSWARVTNSSPVAPPFEDGVADAVWQDSPSKRAADATLVFMAVADLMLFAPAKEKVHAHARK